MRLLIFASIALCVALIVGVRYWEDSDGHIIAAVSEGKNERPAKKKSSYGRTVTIPAANNHQYYVEAKVNNRRTRFLVDTGAVYVALRESDLQRAGILLNQNDFSHGVSTANGKTRAALVSIDEIEIDGVLVNDVDAFVLSDDRLDINLLGMSFLSELSSVETRNGEMILKQ